MVKKVKENGRMTTLILYPSDVDTLNRLKDTGKKEYRTRAKAFRYAVKLVAQAEGVA